MFCARSSIDFRPKSDCALLLMKVVVVVAWHSPGDGFPREGLLGHRVGNIMDELSRFLPNLAVFSALLHFREVNVFGSYAIVSKHETNRSYCVSGVGLPFEMRPGRLTLYTISNGKE